MAEKRQNGENLRRKERKRRESQPLKYKGKPALPKNK